MRNSFLAFAFLGLAVCVSGEYFIEITPNSEPNYYEMKINDSRAFTVSAYEKGEKENSLTGLEEKVWWEYDKSLLEKLSSDETSITLKAIREGISELSATTIVKTQHCQKKINIAIIE